MTAPSQEPTRLHAIVPFVTLPRTPDELDALAIANGRHPGHDRARRLAGLAALVAVVVLVLGQLLGCGAALSTATTSANQTRGFLDVSRSAIEGACVPAYQAAKVPADVTQADAVCLPARTAYLAARAAWMGAVAAILLAQSTGDEAALRSVIPHLAAAAVELARAVEALRQ